MPFALCDPPQPVVFKELKKTPGLSFDRPQLDPSSRHRFGERSCSGFFSGVSPAPSMTALGTSRLRSLAGGDPSWLKARLVIWVLWWRGWLHPDKAAWFPLEFVGADRTIPLCLTHSAQEPSGSSRSYGRLHPKVLLTACLSSCRRKGEAATMRRSPNWSMDFRQLGWPGRQEPTRPWWWQPCFMTWAIC